MRIYDARLHKIAQVSFSHAQQYRIAGATADATDALVVAVVIANLLNRGPALCLDLHDGYVCNLALNHVEDHECNDDINNLLLATWPQDA